jgi:NAD(P)-dependent dehydrogenase (short-subunit alcohol dehydrogenase family)
MSNETTRTAIVTGGSRGIGAAIAQRLAKDGFTVVINYAGNAAEAENLVAKIKQKGDRAISVQADVSDPAAMRRMFDQAAGASGGVDVLVNNAGIMLLSTIADAEDAAFDRQVAVNLNGVFNGLREAAKRLRTGGRIISFLSSRCNREDRRHAVRQASLSGAYRPDARRRGGRFHGHRPHEDRYAPSSRTGRIAHTGKDELRALSEAIRLDNGIMRPKHLCR